MENPTARTHPLNVAGVDDPAVAEGVFVFGLAFEHVGDGLDPSVRMPRKSRYVIGRIGSAKIVEQQKGIE
jgi:hypothetical protein